MVVKVYLIELKCIKYSSKKDLMSLLKVVSDLFCNYYFTNKTTHMFLIGRKSLKKFDKFVFSCYIIIERKINLRIEFFVGLLNI